MNAIGGYHGLELRDGEHYHQNALRLNTARNCLEYILLAYEYKKIYIPFYSCEAILEPFKKCSHIKCEYEFYSINEYFECTSLPDLKDGEALLYINYYGLKGDYVRKLVNRYHNKLIVDNSQAFYESPHEGVATFYSPRKFFGVSDGAYLYTNKIINTGKHNVIQDFSYDRMKALLKRIDKNAEEGYKDFQDVETELSFQPIKIMSKLTSSILKSIDYNDVKNKRRLNYSLLQRELGNSNPSKLEMNESAVPLCYPFIDASGMIKTMLKEHRIYCPTYWPNVKDLCCKRSFEFEMADKLIAVPIDQRYGENDMLYISELIKSVN